MADSACFCTLSHEGVLAIVGNDARNLLQGQLTCNLNYLSETRSSLGARCTQKGRMQSSFRIVLEPEGYLLAMARELVESQLVDLKKYAVFFKSKLTDDSTSWVRFGLHQADAPLENLGLNLPAETDSVVRASGLIAIRVSKSRAELWTSAEQAQSLEQNLKAQLPKANLNQWILGQIRAGIGHVMPQTRESFIPQMLNLQAVGAVSFKKGCYTGQEVVARTQYLGKLKRRLYRLHLESDELPAPATLLFTANHGSSVGQVVVAAHAENGIELLCVLTSEAVEMGEIYIGDMQGPILSLLDLPYQLDHDREIQQ